jgi:hypothetical protein
MGALNFDIRIDGYGGLPAGAVKPNWPIADLTPEEKELAFKFGLTEEQYQRSKLALAERSERILGRARQLGEQVQTVLDSLGSDYRLVSVVRNLDTTTWKLEIQTPNGITPVVLSWELVDDVLDAGTRSELKRLTNMVLFGLGRGELIFEKKP